MDGMVFALIALIVAGLASVLGIWMERDPTRPPRWAIGLSVLIIMATVVSIFQSVEDAKGAAKMEDDMARMLQTLDKLSSESPELTAYLSKEMEAQSRSNPDVINKVAARVVAEGGNANEMLARHLPAGELKPVAGEKSAAPAGVSKAEAEKLKANLAQAKEKAAAAEAAQKELQATLEKNAEAEKAAAEKLKEMEEQIEKLKKQLKSGGAGGATRWGKG